VRGATRETFLDYINRWYKAPKMVVGIAGNFDEGVRREVEELLSEVEAGDPGGPAPVESTNGSAAVQIHSKDSDQAHIAIGVPSYPLSHPDRYPLQLVGTVLGTGMSSRLFTEVRERRGLAYYVFATNHSYTDTGTLYSQAGVDINRIDEAIETIVRELRKIADEPVPAEELDKSKNVAKGRFVLQTESPHGMITFGLRREVLEGRVEEPEEVLRGIDAVTVEDVQRVAQDVIAGNGLKLALIGPFDDAERFERILAA
jgi:predicted Zn-dependent peptidase